MEELNKTEGLASPRANFDYDLGPARNPTLDNIKARIAGALKSAATTLRQKTPQSSGVSGFASQASGWLDNAGTYVEDLNPAQVKSDIQQQMRANPGRALLIAGAVGLVAGTLLRRR